MAQQAHTVPNLDLHVAQGLRKVRSSWRRKQQRKGSGRFSFPTAEPGEGMGLQNQRARCPDELQDLKHLVFFQSCQNCCSSHLFQPYSSTPGTAK